MIQEQMFVFGIDISLRIGYNTLTRTNICSFFIDFSCNYAFATTVSELRPEIPALRHPRPFRMIDRPIRFFSG